MSLTLADIHAAREAIGEGVYRTPCPESVPLSLLTGSRVFCKLEQLQRTGSFKERGGRYALLKLTDEQRKRGVIAASAGNHALALAFHGKQLGVPVTVVMPTIAPLSKVANCQKLGAEVIQTGQTIADCAEHARSFVEARGLTYINGFDDAAIIAGQGTLGLEVLEQVPDLDAIIVPVGGAGLIAGVALAIKSLKPSVQVIGVEPKRCASFTAALEAGKPVRIESRPTIADGLAVPCVGPRAFEIARQHVDKVVAVSERALAMAVLRLIELEKSVVEGAGAAGLAALLWDKLPELKGKCVVLPLCGGNIDTPVLGHVIDRGLAVDGRLCRFETTISDRPGGLAKFATLLGEMGVSIRDITHDRAFAGEDLSTVVVRCSAETRNREHMQELISRLEREGYTVHVDEWWQRPEV
ncbi:MAG: threonine ammonia-lyase [Phycisphaeraceae bacterium]